ncbi:cold-shock protein [Noviherbaspirillum malthae]|uniref:cold-shock protein n=1 Tax=Noviherbaspirillum malthae TaxID=1260987 RepID=UPI00188FFE26|nr:cold shock domain-containing protein [Noviherbaspirillum malthae]
MYDHSAIDIHAGVKNPHKVENLFLFLTALAFAGGGGFALLQARKFIEAGDGKIAIAAGLTATILFVFAIKMAITCLSQLRFVLGRGFPAGLARELRPSETGAGFESVGLQEQMRHQAISFPEPDGIMSGVLYSLVKGLETAPDMVQHDAVRLFHSLLGMVGILFSLALSYFLFEGTKYEGLVSWIYLPLTGLSILSPFMQKNKTKGPPNSKSMLFNLVGMVAFAVVGPSLVTRFAPVINVPPMWVAPAVLLITSIVAISLFLASAFSLIEQIPQTGVSCKQTVIDMNCHPAQLWSEIGRDFQNNWTFNAPNRAYINEPPVAQDGDRGQFAGNIMEETQPEVVNSDRIEGIGHAFSVPYARFLVLLAFWGLGLAAVASFVAAAYVPEFDDYTRMEITRAIVSIVALGTASALSLQIGHSLWGRMYFKSRLVWIEVNGTFQTSKLDIGNQVVGAVRSRSTLTRIEDATLRVWVTDVVSVAFGKDSPRSIIGMATNDAYANSVAERMKAFAANQSTIVAPMSRRDADKLKVLQQFDKAIKDGLPTAPLRELRLQPNALGEARLTAADGEVLEGVVKFYNDTKGFGFLRGEDGVERFFSGDSWIGAGRTIRNGERVEFTATTNRRGPAAIGVREVA